MKRIFSFLFAILFAVGTTGVFSSCQEDAPEITINITMNNDFSDVVNAINNGTLKQEAAIAALTAAINGMNGSEPVKLDALIEAINKLASTIDAKLAILEAAMKAQTLSLENKLALLETALKAIADNIKAQEGQYADELAALKTSIDAIKSEVEAGNKSQEDALAEIIALLESGAIAGGGSGSGSGGEGSGGEGSGGEGEGGEGSGDEPTGPYILLKTNKSKGDIIEFACYDSELTSIKGVEGGVDNLQVIGSWNSGNGSLPLYRGKLTSQEVKLYGSFTEFQCSGEGLTEIDTQTKGLLVILQLYDNPGLIKYNFESNTNLKDLDLGHKTFSAYELSNLMEQLGYTFGGKLRISYDGVLDDIADLIDDAKDNGWTITII